MRSPIVAILWELWRVTRAEIAWKLALPLGIALAAVGLGAVIAPADDPRVYQDANDNLAALALILIVLPHLPGWLSIARLNGSQPGFPLYLLYTRPVRTVVVVGLPMAYLTTVSAAIYLVSAMVLRVASGYAFPLRWTAWGELNRPTVQFAILTRGAPPESGLNTASPTFWPRVIFTSQPLTPYRPPS